MFRIKKVKTFRKKAMLLKRIAVQFTLRIMLFQILYKNKRAVSAVISNLILIGAVIAVGMIALAYARSVSNNYQSDYSSVVGSEVAKLRETIAFEYISYETSNEKLDIYFMNAGVSNLNVKKVLIDSTSTSWFIEILSPNMYYFNGTETSVLGVGKESRITINSLVLASGEYRVTLITGSDSKYVNVFLV